MTNERITQLDQRYANMIAECASGDNESDHGLADELLLALLTVIGCHKAVEAYNEASKNFWCA